MRTNPRIQAQLDLLYELKDIEFDVDAYTGEFIHNHWKPKFHFYQGIENYRQVLQKKFNDLELELKKWEKLK